MACSRPHVRFYSAFTAYNRHVGLFSSDNKHVAIKILSGYATRLNREQKLRELEVFQCLASADPKDTSNHCASLLTHFTHPGIEKDDGEHLCLVTELFTSNVQDVREALPDTFIPVPTVKRILKHVLLGIAHLHKHGIAHTGMFAPLRS